MKKRLELILNLKKAEAIHKELKREGLLEEAAEQRRKEEWIKFRVSWGNGVGVRQGWNGDQGV